MFFLILLSILLFKLQKSSFRLLYFEKTSRIFAHTSFLSYFLTFLLLSAVYHFFLTKILEIGLTMIQLQIDRGARAQIRLRDATLQAKATEYEMSARFIGIAVKNLPSTPRFSLRTLPKAPYPRRLPSPCRLLPPARLSLSLISLSSRDNSSNCARNCARSSSKAACILRSRSS